ncbi:hypothetical protein B0T19DRAFT_461469 [Cercophora scortea]|uniref:Uncharacterized protein n=1 Tax=Cercophora scortea TaxID=314031 RepID=A0AAE0INN7_9PEZI|nr:hypothetical protein B0T19DRAFT_461469 [Cercophora scortea]
MHPAENTPAAREAGAEDGVQQIPIWARSTYWTAVRSQMHDTLDQLLNARETETMELARENERLRARIRELKQELQQRRRFKELSDRLRALRTNVRDWIQRTFTPTVIPSPTLNLVQMPSFGGLEDFVALVRRVCVVDFDSGQPVPDRCRTVFNVVELLEAVVGHLIVTEIIAKPLRGRHRSFRDDMAPSLPVPQLMQTADPQARLAAYMNPGPGPDPDPNDNDDNNEAEPDWTSAAERTCHFDDNRDIFMLRIFDAIAAVYTCFAVPEPELDELQGIVHEAMMLAADIGTLQVNGLAVADAEFMRV